MEDAAHAASAAHGESAGGLPQFDPSSFPGQIFWLAIFFGILYVLMAGTVLPKLGGVIEQRRDHIADDMDRAAELKRQADDAHEAYNSALADARAKARAHAAETREKLDAELRTQQQKADAEIATRTEAAEARIGEMRASAAAKVKDAAKDTAKAIVETLIDEVPTDQAVAEAVETASKSANA